MSVGNRVKVHNVVVIKNNLPMVTYKKYILKRRCYLFDNPDLFVLVTFLLPNSMVIDGKDTFFLFASNCLSFLLSK